MTKPTKNSGSSSKRRKLSTKKSMGKLRESPENLKKRCPPKHQREMIFPLIQNSQVMLSSGSLLQKGKKSSALVKSKPYGILLIKRTNNNIKMPIYKTRKRLMKKRKSGKANMGKDPRKRLLRRTQSPFQRQKRQKEVKKAKGKTMTKTFTRAKR